MRFSANGHVLLLLFVLVPATSVAQQRARRQEGLTDRQRGSRADTSPDENISQSRLLNPNEGLSVLGAALESRGRSRSKPDCSHLVHTVYERAGFPYSYVSSSDLFAGVDEFRRLTRPQPGDLVVWPGHVGIVVNPAQDTFFSALRSGIGVESYSSSYWKDRGEPRFYRYAKAAATEDRGSTIGTPRLTPTALEASANTVTAPAVDVNPASIKFPHLQVINSARPRPEEVTQALLLTLSISSDGLHEADMFIAARSLIVFSRLEVRAVKIHGDQGRAEVRITVPVSVDRGQASLRKRQEVQRWPLRRRDQKSWELLFPEDIVYMPRQTAVRVLSHQLALLADSESPSVKVRQKALAEMLNTLLAE